jgi:hypothetical protein
MDPFWNEDGGLEHDHFRLVMLQAGFLEKGSGRFLKKAAQKLLLRWA